MKKSSEITEFLIISIVGTLWHFIYEWSGDNALIGMIAPINESVWEHLKLLFFPTVIYSASEYYILSRRPENYITASALGLFSGMFSIAAFFYIYSGILGFTVSFLNILSFFIGLTVMLAIKKSILSKKLLGSVTALKISLAFLTVTAVLFGIWSFFSSDDCFIYTAGYITHRYKMPPKSLVSQSFSGGKK